MKITVETSTGSVYRIDPKMQFWERLNKTSESGTIRTAFGFYNELNWETRPDGLRMALTCEAITPGTDGRLILTSPVRKVEAGA